MPVAALTLSDGLGKRSVSNETSSLKTSFILPPALINSTSSSIHSTDSLTTQTTTATPAFPSGSGNNTESATQTTATTPASQSGSGNNTESATQTAATTTVPESNTFTPNMTPAPVPSSSYSSSLPPSSPVLPSSSAPPSERPTPKVGAIAGGTVGGFVVLASFGLIAFLWLARRRRNRIAPSAAYRAAYGTTPPPTFPRAQSTPPSHHLLLSQGSDSLFVSRSRNTIFDGHRSSVAF